MDGGDIHAYNTMKTEANAIASETSNSEQLRGWFVKYACNTRVSCPTRFPRFLRSRQCAM